MIPPVTPEQLDTAAKRFDTEFRETPEWSRWEENASHKYGVMIGDRSYPVKKLLSLATGVPVSEFSGGEESNRVLAQQGFRVFDLHGSADPSTTPDLRGPIQRILEQYAGMRASMAFSGSNEVASHFRAFATALEQSKPVRQRSTVKVTYSYGKGNWAKVPWVALLDGRETASTTEGTYVVYLFRQDMSGVYLTLNQGVTEPKARLGTAEARSLLARRASDLRAQSADLAGRGFLLDDEIDLKADPGLGASYEDSTAAYKLYETGALPPDSELLADLDSVLQAYDRYLSEKGNSGVPVLQSSWIFQSNPDTYDLTGALASLQEIPWVVRQHRSRVHAGDKAYLWESGSDAGIVAIGTILTEPASTTASPSDAGFWRDQTARKAEDEPSVRVRVDRILPRRLPKESLKAHPTLGSLTILRAPVGTNFAVTPEQGRALEKLLAGPASEVAPGIGDAQPVLDALQGRGFVFEPWQVGTYLAALRTKPFVILAGITGTGKSKLPSLVAEATGGNPQLIPVSPGWTDSSEVLGYVDLQGHFRPGPLLEVAKRAIDDPDHQYVCILHEMNLARVEHYFAEVLSRMEDRHQSDTGGFVSGPLYSGALRSEDAAWGRVGIPANLSIVGTVNMDESTHGFSRKVLDRAFTLELSEVALQSWERSADIPTSTSIWPVEAWYPRALQLSGVSHLDAEERARITELISNLTEVNTVLKGAQLQIGYRSRDELGLFLLHARELDKLFVTRDGIRVDPMDLAFNLKVLPRLVGGTGPVRRALCELLGWAWDGKIFSDELQAKELLGRWHAQGRATRLHEARFPFTAGRLCLMWERLLTDGYTSFWL